MSLRKYIVCRKKLRVELMEKKYRFKGQLDYDEFQNCEIIRI